MEFPEPLMAIFYNLLKSTPISVVPPNVFTDKAIEDFQITIRNLFLSPERDFAKSYLKLFIERITISGRKVRIEGRPIAILYWPRCKIKQL